MSTMELRKKTAELICRILDEEIPAEIAIEQLDIEDCGADKSIERVAHALIHFRDDKDSRRMDTAYAERQYKALRAMADQLAKGLPLSEEHGYW